MSSGKAVVVSQTEGLADYVRDGVNCRLVPPGDVQALAKAVTTLLSNVSERKRLGIKARQFVLSSCSPQANATQLATVLNKLTG